MIYSALDYREFTDMCVNLLFTIIVFVINCCRSTLNRLNRSEAFQKFRILMQQSSCSGASSPKLSKMLEVLFNHFSMFLEL